MTLSRSEMHQIGIMAMQLGVTSVQQAGIAMQRGLALSIQDVTDEDIARWQRTDYAAARRVAERGHA